ncbi:putative secreted protein [Lysobacter dokdonensis DS-58]|uniref:Putative secreted protein n=1 Tax=Lysobacter dokdonensis DS-58 TaxID=1300345 RepID=A0A0A2WEC0_9GAMM|nr:putative secreted protein [Lysobacter dokdonensis DS-58]
MVARVFADEGARVHSGEPLLQIDVPRTTATGHNALELVREALNARSDSVRSLWAAQRAQIDAQSAGTRQQLTRVREELNHVKQAIATRDEQILIARNTVERYRRLAADDYVSQVQLDQQAQGLLDLVNERQRLELQAASTRRGIAQLEQSLREMPAQRQLAQAQAQREQTLLDQESIERETSGGLQVVAPVAGILATRLVEPGQAVQPGEPLLSLLPEGSQLQAQLLVPSRAVGFIEPGDSVLMRYQAFPYQKFGHQRGTVVRVSRSAINPGESMAPVVRGQTQEPYYRVLVALEAQSVTAYGKSETLRPGMLLEADILGERRSLIEWILEPLYSLNGKLGGA